jgi:TetR/AcrR family tetracycline transcriptional repressor
MATLVLTREQIVEEALALLREGGLAEVSLRKIAARLGVKAPSLYWHVESKEALHTLMSQAIFRSCLDAVPACTDWREWLRAFGIAIWRAQRAIPDIQQLILGGRLDESARQRVCDEIVGHLARGGLDRAIAAKAQRSVQALATGWVTLKDRGEPIDQSPEETFRQSLNVLIDGWAQRAAGLHMPMGR